MWIHLSEVMEKVELISCIPFTTERKLQLEIHFSMHTTRNGFVNIVLTLLGSGDTDSMSECRPFTGSSPQYRIMPGEQTEWATNATTPIVCT